MKASIKWILWGLAFAAALFICISGYFLWRMGLIATAYKAKILCSGIFISKRNPNSILSQELLVDDLSLLRFFNTSINYDEQSVSASFFGLVKRKAIFRHGLGCTLVIDSTENEIRSQANPFQVPTPSNQQDQLWPEGERVETDRLPPEIDEAKLEAKLKEALDAAFAEPDPARLRRTRAVVIVYQGRIIAERYAQGFSQNTPLIGWSMTKSVINALIGILVGEKKLSLEDRDLLPEWRKPGDPRRAITLDHLLRMSSGLEFSEEYTHPLKDVVFMLLGRGNMAVYAADKRLEAKPGSKWHYSSGTTNIISRIIRNAIRGTEADYFAFPRQALFDRISMGSAIIELDAAGTFVGSSFMYATARDWARFGLLYLQDGIWQGKRILPEGWVNYSVTPAPSAPLGEYGAHFWLKVPPPFRSRISPAPLLPADTFFAAGYEGQFVTVIPSRKLVVVRLGLTRIEGSWDQESFIAQILEAIPK